MRTLRSLLLSAFSMLYATQSIALVKIIPKIEPGESGSKGKIVLSEERMRINFWKPIEVKASTVRFFGSYKGGEGLKVCMSDSVSLTEGHVYTVTLQPEEDPSKLGCKISLQEKHK